MPLSGFGNTQTDLHRAFQRAFADGKAFQATHLFEALGYNADQSRQMGEVTPRPASLTVEFTPGQNSASGSFALITVRAVTVKYYNLVIDHAVFEFPDVELDPVALASGELLFLKAKQIRIQTNVSESDIIHVFGLFAKARNLSDLHMKISPTECVLKGKCRKSFLVMAFRLSGEPNLKESKVINFNCRKLILNGLSIPRGAVTALFNKVNPVFDARKTWLNLDLQKITLEPGFVHSWGVINPPNPPGVGSGSQTPAWRTPSGPVASKPSGSS